LNEDILSESSFLNYNRQIVGNELDAYVEGFT